MLARWLLVALGFSATPTEHPSISRIPTEITNWVLLAKIDLVFGHTAFSTVNEVQYFGQACVTWPSLKLEWGQLYLNDMTKSIVEGSYPRRVRFLSEDLGMGPGWCGSVDGALAYKPKGRWFASQSGHMHGLQARSPVGGAREATTHWCFSPSLSPPFPSL